MILKKNDYFSDYSANKGYLCAEFNIINNYMFILQ